MEMSQKPTNLYRGPVVALATLGTALLVAGSCGVPEWIWSGQGTTQLTREQALGIIGDVTETSDNRTNALGRVFVLSKQDVLLLQQLAQEEGRVGITARTCLDNLKRLLEDR